MFAVLVRLEHILDYAKEVILHTPCVVANW